MKKRYLLISSFVVLLVTVLFIGPQAYADDAGQFNQMIQELHNHRAQVEMQLGLDPQAYIVPHASSYYDDLADHYEQVLIMSDFIDKGIR
jgi:hypothetical protein